MTEHVDYLKAKADCGCGCGTFGTLRARPWVNGVTCVQRGCPCNRCKGKRSRSKGDGQARKVRRALGAGGAHTRHEEGWGGSLRLEVKAGAQVNPIATRFLAAKAQSELARPIGDHRPFALAACPDKGKRLLVIEEDELPQVVAALAENWGLTS